jgi:hypothetical protein
MQALVFMLMAGVAPLTVVHQADAQPAAPPTAQAVTCAPGTPITLTGNGPGRAAFLLYFGSRPVGGGSVNAAGQFKTTLVVGRERAGDYPVMVRVRGTPDVLLSFTCTVPTATSAAVTTPIQVAVPAVEIVAPTEQPASTPIPTAVDLGIAQCQPGQIKGNRNSMIYHMPGQRDYEKTDANVACFDTEIEAQAAGYRRAKR